MMIYSLYHIAINILSFKMITVGNIRMIVKLCLKQNDSK